MQASSFTRSSLDPTKIPRLLRDQKQWVLYREVPNRAKNGKPRKIPYQLNGEPASVSDPSTWSSFVEVYERLISQPKSNARGSQRVDGFGYVFNGTEVCGIDLDNAVLETGQIHPNAARLLSSIDGYKEVSPSGKGFHIITLGEPPWTGARSGDFGIEVYKTARFFTVTTQALGGSATELTRSVDLSALREFDPDKLTPVPTSTDGLQNLKEPDPTWTIERVRGELLEHLPDYPYPQWFQVGSALHHQFAGSEEAYELFDEYSQRGHRYVGPQDTRRLWNSIRDIRGKKLTTIGTLIHLKRAARQVERNRESPISANQDEPLLMNMMDAENQIRSIDWLIDGVIKSGSINMFAGPPSQGKTYAALDLVLSVATGKPWLGKHKTKQGPVVFVACEGRDSVLRRVKAWRILKHKNCAIEDAYITRAEIVVGADENVENSCERLSEYLAAEDIWPRCIVLDTMNYTLGEYQENDANDMTKYFSTISRTLIRRFNTAVILVHHTNKDAREIRGSTTIRGALDTLFMVKHENAQYVIRNDKHKDSDVLQPIYLESRSVSFELSDGKTETNIALFDAPRKGPQLGLSEGQQKLIAFMKVGVGLGGNMSKKEIREQLGADSGNFARNLIKPLLQSGYIEEIDTKTIKLLKTGDEIDDEFGI